MKIKTATGVIKWYMKKLNFKGWASFWNTSYVMPGYEHATWLIRHEIKHIERIKRDGRIWFPLGILTGTLSTAIIVIRMRSRLEKLRN